MSATVRLEDFFKPVLSTGVNVLSGGVSSVETATLSPNEVATIESVIQHTANIIGEVSPKLSSVVLSQRAFVIGAAQIIKAKMDNKPITYPAQNGTIGITPIIPQFINYGTIGNYVAQTSYPRDSWDLSLTAGTPVYLLGSSTAAYTTSGQTNQRFALAILQDGLIEVGTVPKVDQFLIKSQSQSQYDPYTVPITYDEPVELGRALYHYPTLGAFIVDWTLGWYWSAMPRVSGTSSIRILGFAFYEYGLFNGNLLY